MDAPLRSLLPPRIRQLPADLAATIALTGLTILAVVLPVVRETPLRIVLGLPFVLFLPGYAFVAALFPEAGESPATRDGDDGDAPGTDATASDGDGTGSDDDGTGERTDDGRPGMTGARAVGDRGIDGIERVALSFGLSIAIVPLLGLALNFTPWGIRLAPILVTVGGFTIGAAIVAAERRRQLPAEERFRVPYRSWWAAGRAELLEPDDRLDAALNVLLVLSVLLAAGSVGYAIVVPTDGEQFTEFYLLTAGDDGELVADDYPEELVVGEPANLTVGIGNEEHSRETYTVVVQLQRVAVANGSPGGGVTNGSGGGSTTNGSGGANVTTVTVEERRELDRFTVELGHGETWHYNHSVVAPGMTGEDRRLKYLLYRGEVPEGELSAETAYRDLHLWVDVTSASS